jgi:putative membrane protein
VVAFVAAGCGDNTMQQGQFMPTSLAPVTTDAQVTQVLLTANQGEVDAGKVAAMRTTTSAVASLANEMVADHTAAVQRLMALGIAPADSGLNQELVAQDRMLMQQLQSIPAGNAFDLTYICSQVRGHTQIMQIMQQQFGAVQSAQLAAEIMMEQSTVQNHLSMALQILQGAGGPAACNAYGGTMPPSTTATGTASTRDGGADPPPSSSGNNTSRQQWKVKYRDPNQ